MIIWIIEPNERVNYVKFTSMCYEQENEESNSPSLHFIMKRCGEATSRGRVRSVVMKSRHFMGWEDNGRGWIRVGHPAVMLGATVERVRISTVHVLMGCDTEQQRTKRIERRKIYIDIDGASKREKRDTQKRKRQRKKRNR